MHLRRRVDQHRAGRFHMAAERHPAPAAIRDRVSPAADGHPGRARGVPQGNGPARPAHRAAATGTGPRHREVQASGGGTRPRNYSAPAVGRQQGGREAMTVLEYDTFTAGAVDPSKWVPLQLPTPDGSIWSYGDPQAKVEAHGGTMQITVNPFRLKHDQVHMLDDPKHLLVTPQPIPIPASGARISAEIAADTYNGNPDDITDGWTGLVVGDVSPGIIFHWMLSAPRVGALYERLPIPGVTPEGGSFSYLVQSPFVSINKPGEFRSCAIALDPRARTAEWTVDGKPFYKTEGIAVEIKAVPRGPIDFTPTTPR